MFPQDSADKSYAVIPAWAGQCRLENAALRADLCTILIQCPHHPGGAIQHAVSGQLLVNGHARAQSESDDWACRIVILTGQVL